MLEVAQIILDHANEEKDRHRALLRIRSEGGYYFMGQGLSA